MALLTAIVFGFCARHGSYSPRDVQLLERLMWLLPVVAVPLAYATLLVPGAKSWWWLGRVNVALVVALLACAVKVTQGFGAPGTGPKGQDVGILVVLCLGLAIGALANAIAGSLILAEHRPAFAAWMGAHRFLGTLLTALAAVPIGAAMGFALGILGGIAFAVIAVFDR